MEPLPPTLAWIDAEGGRLELLDQTRLPSEQIVLRLRTLDQVIDAIARLAVRGAPALGVVAAYGVVLGVRERALHSGDAFHTALDEVCARLIAARPTAVNLSLAVGRVRAAGSTHSDDAALLACARDIHAEDRALCEALAEVGWDLVADGARVLTHCNTGRLATAGEGTALALLFEAHRRGRGFTVIANETRPLLQGARLTALELSREGIPVVVIADSAAAGLMARGEVDLVLVGADRIARNGDAANKVGTYGLALAAAAHHIPFWIVAPHTTFDLELEHGDAIPIEERDPKEVLRCAGHPVTPPGVSARNPAFDVTPAHLMTGIVTDLGRIQPVTATAIKATLSGGRSSGHDHGRERSSELAQADRHERLPKEAREASRFSEDERSPAI